MAQLNYYTYLSQASWLIIIYVLYYYYTKQNIIPRILEKIKIKNYYKQIKKSTIHRTVYDGGGVNKYLDRLPLDESRNIYTKYLIFINK